MFPERELRCLSPSFHIHVSVSDLYIPTIGPPIFLQQNMKTHRGNIKITHRNWNIGIVSVAALFSTLLYLNVQKKAVKKGIMDSCLIVNVIA